MKKPTGVLYVIGQTVVMALVIDRPGMPWWIDLMAIANWALAMTALAALFAFGVYASRSRPRGRYVGGRR
jgi:TctA family transporter